MNLLRVEKPGHFSVKKVKITSRKIMPGPKSKFETFLVKMATVEALQDPFFHMYTFASDDENFKSLDVSILILYFKINSKQICRY